MSVPGYLGDFVGEAPPLSGLYKTVCWADYAVIPSFLEQPKCSTLPSNPAALDINPALSPYFYGRPKMEKIAQAVAATNKKKNSTRYLSRTATGR